MYLCIVLCLAFRENFAQPIQLKGYVLEEGSGATISNALLLINGRQIFSTENGHYTFISSTVVTSLEVHKLGFKSIKLDLLIKRDTTINCYMEPSVQTMTEVQVRALGQQQSDKASGLQSLSKAELEHTPGFMGQKDVFKAIRSLPGVGNGGEGNSGLFIRGGTAGQNLTLFNDAIIYNPSHMLGLFSVFNPSVTEEINLYKAGVPAAHTGRLSSLIDIKSSRKLEDSLRLEADISPFSLNAGLLAPLSKSWTIGVWGRKTFMNQTVWPIMNKLSSRAIFNKINYDFYDVNFLSNIRLGPKDFIYISAYSGGDDFKFDITRLNVSNSMDWVNTALSVSWKRYLNSRLTLENTVTYSGYQFKFGMSQEQYQVSIRSAIKDYNLRSNLEANFGKHQLKAGVYLANHYYKPNTPAAQSAGVEVDYGSGNVYYADESAVYISDDFAMTDKMRLNTGIRLNYFRNKGPYSALNEDGSQIIYKRAETVSDYLYLEPSASINYRFNPSSSLKVAFTKNTQALHLISVTAVNFPADFWMPSIGNANPAKGFQGSIGYYKDFYKNSYHAFADIFYKRMDGLTEFSGGMMNLIDNLKIEDNLYFGKGESWGAEIFAKKSGGTLSGWISYTLAFANRQFLDINEGKTYPFKYDRRHDFSINAHYKLNKMWSISASFTYASGNAYTKPSSRYMIGGNIVNEYGSFNGNRMPAYHRMDVAAGRKLRSYRRIDTELSISVYNIYNRQNPMYMFYMAEGDLSKYQVSVQPKSVALLPVLPAVNYKIFFK